MKSKKGMSGAIQKIAEKDQENMTMQDPKIEEPKQLAEPKYSPGLKSKYHMKKIDNFAKNNKMVNIKYKDKEGEITERMVEPYKIENGDFWGYDPNKEGIRRFKLDNLKKVKGTEIDFSPRWEVKTAKVGMSGYIEKIVRT